MSTPPPRNPAVTPTIAARIKQSAVAEPAIMSELRPP